MLYLYLRMYIYCISVLFLSVYSRVLMYCVCVCVCLCVWLFGFQIGLKFVVWDSISQFVFFYQGMFLQVLCRMSRDEWMCGWMDVWMYVRIRMDMCGYVWIYMNGWMHGWTDGRMDGLLVGDDLLLVTHSISLGWLLWFISHVHHPCLAGDELIISLLNSSCCIHISLCTCLFWNGVTHVLCSIQSAWYNVTW